MATAKDGVLVKPNTRSKRGGWIVDIRIKLPSSREPIRERTTIPAANKTEARNWGLRRKEEILRQGGTGPLEQAERPEVPTLGYFKDRFVREHLKAEGRKPSSQWSVDYIFDNHLMKPLGEKRLDEITVADVQALKGELADKLSKKTVNNVLTVLSSMLRRAVDWNVIPSMPRVKLLKAGKSGVQFYSFEEFTKLLEAAHALDLRIEAMALLGGDAGLRRGEIMALEWRDVDFTAGQLRVERSECEGEVTLPKGGAVRHVPMTSRLAQVLKDLRHLRGPRVLYNDEGRTVNATLLWQWMTKATVQAGLPKRGGLHILRHTFCSHLAMRGAPAKTIQELAGHTTLTMTMRYMHLSPGAKEAAIGLLEDRGTTEAQPGATKTTSSKNN